MGRLDDITRISSSVVIGVAETAFYLTLRIAAARSHLRAQSSKASSYAVKASVHVLVYAVDKLCVLVAELANRIVHAVEAVRNRAAERVETGKHPVVHAVKAVAQSVLNAENGTGQVVEVELTAQIGASNRALIPCAVRTVAAVVAPAPAVAAENQCNNQKCENPRAIAAPHTGAVVATVAVLTQCIAQSHRIVTHSVILLFSYI